MRRFLDMINGEKTTIFMVGPAISSVSIHVGVAAASWNLVQVTHARAHTHTHTHTRGERERKRERERETDRQTDRQTERERERDRQTDRQTDRVVHAFLSLLKLTFITFTIMDTVSELQHVCNAIRLLCSL